MDRGIFSWVCLLYLTFTKLILRSSALKTGGEEITREKWDEAYDYDERRQDMQSEEMEIEPEFKGDSDFQSMVSGQRPPGYTYLPDWTRVPLNVGAPSASKLLVTSQIEDQGVFV